MNLKSTISRRKFMGGVAATVGYFGLRPETELWAQGRVARANGSSNYDDLAKLANNENPYGPTDVVMKAMTGALKYSNRYGYPDGGLVQAIAAHHGVNAENIILGVGSTEILQLVDSAFLQDGKKVIGVEPTYGTVYEFATGLKSDAIRLPLMPDHRLDIPGMIKAAKANAKGIGFVYVCNPNNPTGLIVTKQEIKQLLDELPTGIPVLIDEAYHHYVEDPNYATSVPYVIEGRPVIIARTFSKIFGLAGMRLGYGIAPRTLIEQMRPHSTAFGINAIVKYGGVAALNDSEGQQQVRAKTLALRKKTTSALDGLGYRVLPSETNFFMVNIRRPVSPVIQEFRQRGILVGRPFPPMLEYLRVSVGDAEEMDRFMAAFKEIFAA